MVLAFSGTAVTDVVLPETVGLVCGGSFTNNKNASLGKAEFTICNPDCEIGGWTKNSSKDAMKHAWHRYVTPLSSNATGCNYVIYVPKDSEVAKTLNENIQKWFEEDIAARGSSVGGGYDSFTIREKE